MNGARRGAHFLARRGQGAPRGCSGNTGSCAAGRRGDSLANCVGYVGTRPDGDGTADCCGIRERWERFSSFGAQVGVDGRSIGVLRCSMLRSKMKPTSLELEKQYPSVTYSIGVHNCFGLRRCD